MSLAVLVAAASALGGYAARAQAARVVVLARDGRATVRNDPFLSTAALTPSPEAISVPGLVSHATAVDGTVRTRLARLYRSHRIDKSAYRAYSASFNSVLAEVRRLSATRAAQLEAVIENLEAITAAGKLTRSRLPALFLTLDRNREWWRSGPLLSYGQRHEFAGSRLVLK